MVVSILDFVALGLVRVLILGNDNNMFSPTWVIAGPLSLTKQFIMMFQHHSVIESGND